MSVPNFIKGGSAGLTSSAGKFVKIKTGEPIEFVCLTGVEAPLGEDPNGSNSVISFNEYTMWLDNLPDGAMSPRFPAIGGPHDPGKLLNLEPRFRALMLVMLKDETDEKILSFTVSVFKQLVEIEQALGSSLRGHVLRLSRSGEGLKTKYRVVATGRKVDIEGEPETNIIDHIGPLTREQIVDMLTQAGVWPPEGGDPAVAAKPAAAKKPATKNPAKVADDDFEVPEE